VAPTIPRDHSSHQTYLEMHIAQGENFARLETPFHKQEGYIEQPMQEKAAEPQVERAMVKGTETKMASFYLQTEIQIPLQTR